MGQALNVLEEAVSEDGRGLREEHLRILVARNALDQGSRERQAADVGVLGEHGHERKAATAVAEVEREALAVVLVLLLGEALDIDDAKEGVGIDKAS